MSNRLENKVTVITGATSGIGEATARLFHKEGAHVVISGRSVDKGEALAGELGDRATFHRADVSRESDIDGLINQTVRLHGRIDCLFNNAGGPTPGDLQTITPEQFAHGMNLLVGSVLFGIKHAAAHMAGHGGGSIINNSSVAAHRLGQGSVLYSAAKAAVSHISSLAGAQLGHRGIRVNAISPGAIATPIFWGGSERARSLTDRDNARKQASLERRLANATPLPRSGLADDIGFAALFLASDEGSFVNGHDLVVDGGRIGMFVEQPSD